MSLLTVEDLSKAYGARPLFDGVGFALARGRRAGLVGPNGAGKSTLLRIVAGREEADGGRVALAARARLGYLAQDPELPAGVTLRQAALDAFSELNALEARLREAERRLERGEDALAEYGELREAFERQGGYEREHRAEEVLGGLGFRPAEFDTPVEQLSGGQRARAALARLLLRQPDVLLLDEPTNHLDLPSIAWLEARLARWPGAALVVSHDRYLLDRVATDILALEDGRVHAYPGGYTAYARQRAERQARAEAERQRHEEERRRLEDYVRRYRAGNRATQAQSRVKRLEKLSPPERGPSEWRGPGLRFRPRGSSGREVLAVESLAKAFGGPALFAGFSAEVARGERVAVLGPNGAGKTTLLRVLSGLEAPSAGEVWWGPGVELALLRQDLGGLDDGATVLDEVLDADPDLTVGAARDLLARFLFRGDAVFTRVGDLSGGERNRLLLCRLMLSRANVLLLDEPTNHLDVPGREALEAALLDFPGTLVFVSHDRYFVDRLATRVWAVGDGRVRDFAGGYTAYQAALAAEAADVRDAREAGATPAPPPPARRGGGAPARGRAQRDYAAEIEGLEAQVREMEERLGDPELYRSGDAVAAVRAYREARARLEELYREWENSLAGG